MRSTISMIAFFRLVAPRIDRENGGGQGGRHLPLRGSGGLREKGSQGGSVDNHHDFEGGDREPQQDLKFLKQDESIHLLSTSYERTLRNRAVYFGLISRTKFFSFSLS